VFTLEFWFTVAIIILFAELTAFLLIMLALFGGLGYGSELLRNKLRREWMPLLQGYAAKGAQLTHQGARLVTTPPIRLESQLAGLRHTVRVLFGGK
jgi:hypothetical protein